MEVISSIYNSGYNIKKFYLGSRELNLAYLGNQVIYDVVIGDNDLNYILYEFYGSDMLPNTVEAPVKSAILKGSTKYRDIDTGDILDTFDETKNLELVSVKVPVLTTQNSILSDIRNYTVKAGRSWEGKEESCFIELISFNGNNVVFKHTGSYTQGFMIQGIPYCSKGSLTLTLKYKRKPENFDGTLFCNFTLFKDGVYVYQTGNKEITYESNTNLYTFTTTLSRDFDSMWITMGIRMHNGKLGEHEFEFVLSNLKTNNTEYKSNILTVNEDVTLRSNGDICDELNLITGQLTQRVGEDGVVLSQEVVKTVDLTVVDQDNQPTRLGTFENVTYVSLVAENLIPEVEMEVATSISEKLASASPLMDDISTKQEQLKTMIDEQSNNVDATMIATTEIYEETL